MSALSEFRSFDRQQRAAFVASFLGWTLDAFDFFVLVFVVKAIADDFHTEVKAVTFAILVTLAMRPLGAFVFGRLADRYGRKPILMIDVCLFSVLELASAFAPSLAVLLVLRALFGFAMGGEWGIGASLVMESIPAKSRGWVSGFLQQGYAFGYLIAAVVYYSLFELIGWRGMFVVGVVPALLVLYIRMNVNESPAWQAMRQSRANVGMLQALRGRWRLFFYVVVLMTAFNFLSHGTQDLYPTFLQVQHGFLNELSPEQVRGTFPGLAYQLGNLIASGNAVLQAQIASTHGGNYGLALALVAGSVAILLAILTSLGTEARGTAMHAPHPTVPTS
jgi:SHS family lactate transporter-like MFS transporter